ncbi:AEC family transporter [Vibrio hannami]|uniref:AEC family transporter n=1 Tax=Vibrio hannami TaxID=2717094 RepID=UPI00240EF4E6|nr:AEC family transporter [Vibrio hannami]MDG3085851.1 AEC family transporter [Vibrio hannami]
MAHLLEQLAFSLSITGPICLMLVLGVVFKRVGLINENFIDVASKLVFQVTLPALLFLSIVNSEHDFASAANFTLFGIIANILFFILTSLTVGKFLKNKQDKGVVVQGAYRANTAIIGLAYVANAYGHDAVAVAAIYVAPMTILYNILAVIALTPKGDSSVTEVTKVMIKSITRNPLILAILAGISFYALSIPVPAIVLDAGQYFANMTLPLALLCTGGSLNLKSLKSEGGATWLSTGYKLLFAPLVIVTAALLLGYRGLELGIIFFMSAAPTAAASYIMARAMGGSPTLAANIIALTTVLSLASTTFGIFLLSSFSLM